MAIRGGGLVTDVDMSTCRGSQSVDGLPHHEQVYSFSSARVPEPSGVIGDNDRDCGNSGERARHGPCERSHRATDGCTIFNLLELGLTGTRQQSSANTRRRYVREIPGEDELAAALKREAVTLAAGSRKLIYNVLAKA